jgi:AraC family transcriptional regulator of adaptative response / DNA-3-methyladenine glycosylase II
MEHRGDVVARAMRLIADGIVDREGVAGLARRLGYSSRHLTRSSPTSSAPGRSRSPAPSGRRPPEC